MSQRVCKIGRFPKELIMDEYLLQQILEQLQKISAQLTAIQANLD